ncbi:hypothetical protein [Rhodococcus sp. RDE2]|uniref:hypothetical protein n=1 Tax=Rhodococcus sp. RDE2 TaxID=2885078 RepID=UPI001E2D2942|nr:hypothetical protein [Rhodococcus sp. RDE2]BDB62381.1 hypothetical protein RDE2_41750 [Rhodococcus sp. RDE2]
MSEYRGGDPGADPAEDWSVPATVTYSAGGWIPGGQIIFDLDPEECIVARREGKWQCIRAHDHGDQSVVNTLNLCDTSAFIETANRDRNEK